MKSRNPAIFSLLFLLIGLVSCDFSQTENKRTDSIRLSTKQAEFEAIKDSLVISTEGSFWWINDVNTDGNYFYADPKDSGNDFANIKGDWFCVEKQGKRRLIVKVSENKSKNDRKMRITIESGNYFDCINVFQRGQK